MQANDSTNAILNYTSKLLYSFSLLIFILYYGLVIINVICYSFILISSIFVSF